MRLSLSRSGGFAGIRPPPRVLDTAELAEPHRARIEQLVTKMLAAPAAAPAPSMPDRFQYELNIEHVPGKHAVVRWSEATPPEAAGELVALMEKKKAP